MQHVIKKKKKRGLWPKLAIRHGHAGMRETSGRNAPQVANLTVFAKEQGERRQNAKTEKF